MPGRIVFETAPDGTQSPAERMRIDSSGNVGIGDTSPAAKLEIKQGSSNWYEGIRINRSDNATQFGTFSNNGGATFIGAADTTGSDNNALIFGNSTNGTTFTERVRIASDGALVVNNSGGNAQIYLGGTSGTTRMYLARSAADVLLWNVSDGHMRFGTNNTERMRIDNSGKILMNTTTQSDSVVLTLGDVSSAKNGLAIVNSADTGTIYSIYFRNASGSLIGSITNNGSNVTYNTSSDARLKDITGEARGLEVINALNPVSYNWKKSGQADEGLIAQEVKEIVPNAVTGSEEEMYQMDYSKLVTPLIKAIQELSAEVEELKTKLESK